MRWPRVFSEPAIADPPRRVWRDWAIIVVVVIAAVVEAAGRAGVPAPWFAAVMTIAMVPTVLWRRTYPVEMTYIAFIGLIAMNVGVWEMTGRASELAAAGFVIVLPYAVFRWGSGRAMAATIPLLAASWAICSYLDSATDTVSDYIGGAVVLAIPCGLGLLVRFRADAQARLLDDARSRERVRLARDLHDSVAHHVSAIVVQAQAGLAVASTDPDAAVGTLERIEATAATTLAEMRGLVGTLRASADLTPQTGLAQLEALTDAVPDGVEVSINLDIDDALSVPEPVQVAIYRITQEALTNAVRHGAQLRHIGIDVSAQGEVATTSICNDGARARAAAGDGYGLIGMAERARQLGGSLIAGPQPGGGWRVRATMPLGASSASVKPSCGPKSISIDEPVDVGQ